MTQKEDSSHVMLKSNHHKFTTTKKVGKKIERYVNLQI